MLACDDGWGAGYPGNVKDSQQAEVCTMRPTKKPVITWVLRAIAVALACGGPALAGDQRAPGLWDLAKAKQGIHRFSTLFTAQQVRDCLSTEGGIDAAIDWCRKTAVTKVYI